MSLVWRPMAVRQSITACPVEGKPASTSVTPSSSAIT